MTALPAGRCTGRLAHLAAPHISLCLGVLLIILLNNTRTSRCSHWPTVVSATSTSGLPPTLASASAFGEPSRPRRAPHLRNLESSGGDNEEPIGPPTSLEDTKASTHSTASLPSSNDTDGSSSPDHLSKGDPLEDRSSGARNHPQEPPEEISALDESQPASEDQSVTCPPDYEDQFYPSDPAAANLTDEQGNQLLNQLAVTTANGSLEQGPASSIGARVPLNCVVVPGKKMIEVITTVITPILFSIIVVVGLLGNLIVMYVIREEKRLEKELTPTNLLILDLSLADLSFITCCIPFTGWDYYLMGQWVFGLVWCKANQYLIVVCALSSIYTLVLMSLDRFMAIVYPIKCISYRTSKNTLYAICIKWILILGAASPAIRMHGLIESPSEPGHYKCRFLEEQFNSLVFQIVFFISSYLFPLVLIFCLYLSLLNKLWYGTKPYGHKESSKMLESKKKVTWLVASIVVVFALCWCPIQVMLILMRLKSHKITATYVAIQVFAHTLGYMNSCVNPIVYAFASESFVNSFKRSPIGGYIYWLLCIGHRNRHNLQNHHNNNNNNNNNNHHHHQHQTQLTTFNAHDYEARSTNFVASHNNATTIQHDNDIHLSTTNQNYHHQLHPMQSFEGTVALSYKVGCSSENRQPTPDQAGTPRNESYNSTSNSTLVSQPCHSTSGSGTGSTTANATTTNNNNNQIHDKTHLSTIHQPVLQPPQATLVLEARDRYVQQQLVAHMVSSGKQISHRCEPYK